MCGADCGNTYIGYNTYPMSPDNNHFVFCSGTCKQNFIDFCLSEFGDKAKELRKKDDLFGNSSIQPEEGSIPPP